MTFLDSITFFRGKMPDIGEHDAHVEVNDQQHLDNLLSSWTRGRLISVNGVWVRVGRLKRVWYRE